MVDVAGRTPVKTDTKARLELQGLTGVAAIALTGGAETTPALVPGPDGEPPTINAEPSQLPEPAGDRAAPVGQGRRR